MVLDNYMAYDIVAQYTGEAHVNTRAKSYTIVFAVTNVQVNNACRSITDPYERVARAHSRSRTALAQSDATRCLQTYVKCDKVITWVGSTKIIQTPCARHATDSEPDV